MPTLDWIGKKAVVSHHKEVPFHLLNRNQEFSVGSADSGNLLVQGDNLLALKALLPYYAGQVKCIYIDPPYNTGNENWIYNDNVNSPEIRQWLGKVVGKEAEDLSRHDKWLCMMYPRLSLLKEFLREDGAIFVSIDDNEVANMRLLMDEIFGHDKFIATIVWQKRYSRENREAIGDVHEYLLVYAINPELFKQTRNRVKPTEEQTKIYKNPNNDPRGRWRAIPMNAQGYRPNQMYPITTPSGIVHYPPEGRCWSMVQEQYEELLRQGRIYFGKYNKSQPNVIRYLSEVEGFVPWTWWPHEEAGHTDEAKKEIHALFGKDSAFDTPKPLRLINRILQIATNPGDLVLDSFAGSGTTGHAVLQINKEDVANRRFILIEMDPNVCRSITSERLRRAINGYTYAKQKGSSETIEGLSGSFDYYEFGDTIFDSNGQIKKNTAFEDLARHIFFVETGEPLPQPINGQSPLIGIANNLAVYLLYNGSLRDHSSDSEAALTSSLLARLPRHDGPKVIYATSCRIGPERLRREGIVFRQIPYEVRTT